MRNAPIWCDRLIERTNIHRVNLGEWNARPPWSGVLLEARDAISQCLRVERVLPVVLGEPHEPLSEGHGLNFVNRRDLVRTLERAEEVFALALSREDSGDAFLDPCGVFQDVLNAPLSGELACIDRAARPFAVICACCNAEDSTRETDSTLRDL